MATRVGSVSAEVEGVPGEVEEVQDCCCNFSEDVEGVYHPASAAGAAAVLLEDTAAAAVVHHVHG